MRRGFVKKVAAAALTAVMVVSLFTQVRPVEAATNGHSADDAINWVRSKEGQGLDYRGNHSYQCVDLIAFYYQYLGQTIPGGNAIDYSWNALPSGWQRIQGAQPQKGDILVYTGGSGNYGHVAVYESDYSVWHQNYCMHPYVEHYTHKYNDSRYMGVNYWGIIRPDWNVQHENSGNSGGNSQGNHQQEIPKDTEKPVISNYEITNKGEISYTVRCKVSDNAGIDRVLFPTFNSVNQSIDEKDSKFKAVDLGNGEYEYKVDITNFEWIYGTYHTTIVAYDKSGNRSEQALPTVDLYPGRINGPVTYDSKNVQILNLWIKTRKNEENSVLTAITTNTHDGQKIIEKIPIVSCFPDGKFLGNGQFCQVIVDRRMFNDSDPDLKTDIELIDASGNLLESKTITHDFSRYTGSYEVSLYVGEQKDIYKESGYRVGLSDTERTRLYTQPYYCYVEGISDTSCIDYCKKDINEMDISEKGIVTGLKAGRVYGEFVDNKNMAGVPFVINVLEKKTEYTVFFENAESLVQESRTYNEKISNLPEPSKEGYIFDGWYKEDGTKAYEGMPLSGNITLTAHWKVKPVNSSVYVGMRVNTDSAEYTVTGIDNGYETAMLDDVFDNAISSLDTYDTITINDGNTEYDVTEIANESAKYCDNLTSLTIGANIEVIGKKAFYGCSSLRKIVIKSDKLQTIGAKAFKKVYKRANVYVPAANYKYYKKMLRKAGLSRKAKIIKMY